MKVPAHRCALYTRKSSDEGLDQAFNSLDAQREACEAYVQSQSGEGWNPLPTRYDDGGFSGGSMDRPALQRLLEDIQLGRVDIVVVYKIDRLTRSLADFARIVEVFEAHQVSFVSVTQAFNTTSSMGRLTLNVLLSFAQFEREVTGERIRDKIAASKKKGMWMGGIVPLGYDLPGPRTHSLRVNETEADTVRHIFRTYLQLGSVYELERRLVDEGIVSKRTVSRRGREMGGQPLSRGALFQLLRNRIYLGEITHKQSSYPGLHDAIVDPHLFLRVQSRLDESARRRRSTRQKVATSSLTGRIFDADGQTMSPTFAYGKGRKLYRYYVSASLQRGGRRELDDKTPRRVSAAALERTLEEVLRRLVPRQQENWIDLVTRLEIREAVANVWIPSNHLIDAQWNLGRGEAVSDDPADPSLCRITLPLSFKARGGKTRLVIGPNQKRELDQTLVKALREAHRLVGTGSEDGPRLEAAPANPHKRRLVRLAFLAPDIQSKILAGEQPADLTLARLLAVDVPLDWAAQRREFGFHR